MRTKSKNISFKEQNIYIGINRCIFKKLGSNNNG